MLFAIEDRQKSVHFREAPNSFRRIGFRGLRLYYYGARYLDPQNQPLDQRRPERDPELMNPKRERFSIAEGLDWYSYCR